MTIAFSNVRKAMSTAATTATRRPAVGWSRYRNKRRSGVSERNLERHDVVGNNRPHRVHQVQRRERIPHHEYDHERARADHVSQNQVDEDRGKRPEEFRERRCEHVRPGRHHADAAEEANEHRQEWPL